MTIMNNDQLTDRESQWRRDLRASHTPAEQKSIPRVTMPELPPEFRRHSRLEVNRGLSAEQARLEASRCLDCGKPGCVTGCPVQIDIPSFVKNIERGHFRDAATVLRLTSALPAVCGRVCPQERQCESKCIYHKMGLQPVAIGYLERFAADTDRMIAESCGENTAETAGASDQAPKVAVIGSGPAGLSFAGEMAARGYNVTVYEALHAIGGVLKYGIPEFRLPNPVVDYEIEGLRRRGVTFVNDCVVGKTISLDDLRAEGYAAIFVGSGAGLPRFMNIPGENLVGVMSSNEYLTRINLMGAGRQGYDTPVMTGKTVAVVGGGNTAMDSVRTALRMGAERAIIIYRRSREEMPARAEEVHHAEQEGVEFMTLHNPLEYLGDERGRLRAVRLQRMELGEPDESRRRSPVPVEGDIVELPVDLAIVSIGVSPNPIIPDTFAGLDISKRGTIVINEETMRSSLDDVYAGGDIVRGGATVILAMGDGRHAAEAADRAIREDR